MIGTANVNNLPYWYLFLTLLFLIGISIYDILYHKIKNLALLFFLIWCLISIPLCWNDEATYFVTCILESLLGLFWGAFIFLAVSYIPGCHIGGGDIKLAALLGFLAGPQGILIISFSSAVYAFLYLQFLCKKSQRAIPFAPFLLLGTLTLLCIWRYQ